MDSTLFQYMYSRPLRLVHRSLQATVQVWHSRHLFRSKTATSCLPLNGSSGNSVGSRVEVEASAVKVDGRLEVLPVAEAVGHFLDGLDLGVETLTDRVRDAVGEERQDIPEITLDHSCR